MSFPNLKTSTPRSVYIDDVAVVEGRGRILICDQRRNTHLILHELQGMTVCCANADSKVYEVTDIECFRWLHGGINPIVGLVVREQVPLTLMSWGTSKGVSSGGVSITSLTYDEALDLCLGRSAVPRIRMYFVALKYGGSDVTVIGPDYKGPFVVCAGLSVRVFTAEECITV